MTSQLKFKVNNELSGSAINPLRMFIQDWIESTCGNAYHLDSDYLQKRNGIVITVKFDHSEDALVLKLKGIPKDLSKYIELSY
jgi:hypothetical protein